MSRFFDSPFRSVLAPALLVASHAIAASVTAQDLPDLTALGGGSRAIGLGYATTAVELDVRSIGWNAANLASVTGVTWAVDTRIVSSYSNVNPSGQGTTGWGYRGESGLALSLDAINFAGAALRVDVAGRPLVVGVAYRRFAEGLRPFTYRIAELRSNGRYWATTSVVNTGGPRALSPTLALRLSDRVDIGVTGNLIGGDGAYKITEPSTNRYTRKLTERSGVAPELGLQVRLSDTRQVAARVVLPHEQRYMAEDNAGSREIVQENPLAVAIGTAWRSTQDSRWSADVRFAPWGAHPVVDPMGDTTATHDAFSVHLGWERRMESADPERRVEAHASTDLRLGTFVKRLAIGDAAGKPITVAGVGVGQTWTWERYAMDVDVGISRSTRWQHPEVRITHSSVASNDFTVGLGLRRR